MKKYSSQYGQGAIEYLLIIAAAILVVAIVILAITGALSSGQEQAGASEQAQGNSFAKLNLINIEDSMVLYWKLNGNATDYFGMNNGVADGGVDLTAQGKFSQGAKFDLDNKFITANKAIMVGNKVTYGGWVKFDSFNCPGGFCLVMEQDSSNEDSFEIYANSTTYPTNPPDAVYGGDPSRKATLTDSNIYCWDGLVSWKVAGEGWPVKAGQWYNVYCVHDGIKMCLWVDGEKRFCWNSIENVKEVNFDIGLLKENNGYDLEGTIDEVMVWNRTLKDSELKALYEIGSEIR